MLKKWNGGWKNKAYAWFMVVIFSSDDERLFLGGWYLRNPVLLNFWEQAIIYMSGHGD